MGGISQSFHLRLESIDRDEAEARVHRPMNRSVLLILAFAASLVACQPDKEEQRIERQRNEASAPPRLDVEPSVTARHDSPSGKYRLEILAYPQVEECSKGRGTLSAIIANQIDNRKDNPCGFRVVDRKTGASLLEYAEVEHRLTKSFQKPSCSFDKYLFLLHGFDQWDADDRLIYTVNSLWLGAADYSATTHRYNWKNCHDEVIRILEDPHCPGLCNSVLFYTVGKQEYLLYRKSDTETIQIFKRKGYSDVPHDFYIIGGREPSMDAQPDPEKVIMVGSLESKDRPRFDSDEEGNLIIKTDRDVWLFNIQTERLEKE
ncbi:MAG: hypothetical protein CVV45_06380 [Spirochaetae bacterium HGW-Spirochaetae-10]|nr:MAG: hypothetical protein CVV45_06380 [Spirochaetae bacterium HGW-Spirochaetae-10]